MAFKITIKEVNVETVTKGKSRYQIAVVSYDFKGEARTQKIMSFSNPSVFKNVQTFNAGDVVEVEVTKNEAGYNEWTKAEKASGGETSPTTGASSSGRVVGSNYETPQERADNRIRIVRQSSLSNAIATLAAGGEPVSSNDVLDLAQRYFDWVYASPDDSDQAKQPSE